MNAGTIVAIAEGSADHATFGRGLVDRLMQDVGAEVAAFRAVARGPAITRGFSPTVFGGSGNPWDRHAAEFRPVLVAAARAGAAVDTAVLGERAVRSARYFSEVVRPHRGRETLVAIASWRSQPAGCLLLGRCGTRGRFAAADIRRIRALLPAIALASTALVATGGRALRPTLSPREAEIVALLGRGLRSREIGHALGTSVNTVRNQISRLMERIGAGTRAELVAALVDGASAPLSPRLWRGEMRE